jgi:hypothetical protein
MPKRTNEFQQLVYLVRLHLAAGGTVTESKMLTDRRTGQQREVDVCIEAVISGEPIVVSIECRDHTRRADVGWVDQMKTKHERLPTNALILASKRGFTPEAKRVAADYGIKVVALVPRHRGFDRLDMCCKTGRSSGGTRTSMLRGTPGWRRMRPARSRLRTIWWTEGGVTPKWRCISRSAGGRRCTRV